MDLITSYNKMLNRWNADKYPKLVYVETTNICNARCAFCLYERMERPVETMSFSDFMEVARKVKQADLKIGAMFCFGEPLADRNLFKKINYGRSLGIMKDHIGLNTNCSMLTPDIYDSILNTTKNITLSFTNIGEKFEDLTKLSWEKCYNNAINFIKYRDKKKPNFKIYIGVNDVTGHNRNAVKKVFNGYNVDWARDAQICWGSKVITGVIDRSIMYHKWSCDGYKGAIQIKPNGDCCFCAYDVIRNETRFANIFVDSWETIEKEFKRLWKRPSSLCLRCDFWWNYYQMVVGGWKRGKHIDDSWQNAYLNSNKDYWDENHKTENKRFLTGSKFFRIKDFLELEDIRGNVLNVGVGLGFDSVEMANKGLVVDGLDISQVAIDKLKSVLRRGFTNSKDLPYAFYDYILCNLVAQHMTDIDLFELMVEVIRSLKDTGIFALQYASPLKKELHTESVYSQRMGLVRRTKEDMHKIVDMAGGIVVKEVKTKYFSASEATDDACWNGLHIKRGRFVKPIGGL